MNVRTLTSVGLSDARRNGAAIAVGAGLLVLGLLFHSEVTAAYYVWSTSTAYNHCFLVIPIVLYLLWDRRSTLNDAVAKPMPIAALAGIPLALAWLVAERLGVMEGRQLVAMTFVELLFFVVLGPLLYWRLCGPLLYLYFLVPFGAFLTPKLQDITTVFVDHGLRILHIPAYITGYTIEIPEGTFMIAEACAGLRFLIAAIAFGCLYSLVMYRTALKRTIFILVSITVPIAANGIRALGIVAGGHYLGSAQAVEADHIIYGWVFFSIVIVILTVLGLPFREDHAEPAVQGPIEPPRGGNYLRPAMLAAAAIIVVAAIGPAVAARFDSSAVVDMTSNMPTLVPAAGCQIVPGQLTDGLDTPGRVIVQHFNCGHGVLTLMIEVFSPRSTANRMLNEQRRLTEIEGAEDVQSTSLNVPGAPAGAWRMVERTSPARIAATSLWIEGQTARLGLAGRAEQAWRSIVGSRLSPILVVVRPEIGGNAEPGPAWLAQGRASIAAFLGSQPALADLITRLSNSAPVKG